MSAHFHGSPFRSRHRPLHGPGTLDLDTTADVHEESTADLEPATADIVPSEVPRPTLASAPLPRIVEEPPIAPGPMPTEAPIVAREAPAADAPKTTTEIQERTPLPLPDGRRQPFVSTPAIAPAVEPRVATATTVDAPRIDAPIKAALTVDVPVRPVAPVSKAPSNITGDLSLPALAAPSPAPRKIAALRAVETKRPALAPGKVLCDRYLLEQVIGCGGTAIVFRARDMLSAKGAAPNLQVAIKTPRPELGDPERAAKRLKHEFEHAKLLSHPSIVRVLELHEDEGRCFMTMELVQGKLLSQMLRDWTMLPVPLAYKILRQCAQALQYAHSQNVVHGDFKPGNVFITPEEGVRIVDFGTAAGPTANDSRIPAGTPTYASPEVLSGETPDARDDVFSFACVAYELLTGQHPFGRQSSLQARDEAKIPPRAWNLSTSQWLSLLSALSWKREQRPASVADLLTRLNPEQSVAVAPAPVYVDPEEVVPAELPADLMPKQRSWGFFAFIACALVVTYFAFQRQNAPDDDQATAPGIVPAPAIVPAASSPPDPTPAAASQPQPEETPSVPPQQDATPAKTTAPVAAAPTAAAKPRAAAAPTSEISFEAPSIVTSETSVAAVFLIKRSQPLSGRVSVSWKAVSGSADAGIDFASEATGSVTFADGQAQRAIYVPLRNDLLKEEDESFYVSLVAPKSARLGKTERAEAIIRDDD